MLISQVLASLASFPWSTKGPETEEPGGAAVHAEAEPQQNGTDHSAGYAPRNDRYSVAAGKKLSTAVHSSGPNKGRGRIKRDSSIRINNGKIENGTLLQYSALSLTIQKIKPGDIPSFPEIIDDLHCLEGANPEQVQMIVDKLEALKLTIASLDKRLQNIDRGLDRLRPAHVSIDG